MNPCQMKLSNALHALTAEFKAFRELMAERDVRYMGMFSAGDKAVASALAAQKEQTQSAFASSEKAIVKAEDAQKAYNTSHNDLARKMDDQNKATMPRTETESRFANLEEKIHNLRESRSELLGGGRGMEKLWGWIAAVVMALIAIAGIYLRK